MARAMGKLLGGGLFDLGNWLPFGPGPFPAYGLVFGVELLVAALALLVLRRVNVRQFREDTGRGLSRIMAMELG